MFAQDTEEDRWKQMNSEWYGGVDIGRDVDWFEQISWAFRDGK